MTPDGTAAWDARRVRFIVAATIIIAAACVTVVVVTRQPSDTLIVAGLYAPSTIGVLLLWRASVYTWRHGAHRPRAFLVDAHAFALFPARPTTRAVAMILASVFPIGHLIIATRSGVPDAVDWAIAAVGAVIVGLAIVHSVFLWRGAPRPLVIVTPAGLTAAGFFGSVHAPWSAFGSDYVSWPDRRMNLALPVYGRGSVRRRGLRPYGVRLPDTSEPFTVPATWSTHPWWAAQVLPSYWRGMRSRSAIGTIAEHVALVRFLDRFDGEINEELNRFR